MSTDRTAHLAAALVDDLPVDWETELAHATDAPDRALIEQFRVLATIATAHREALAGSKSAHDSVVASASSTAYPPIGRWGHLDLLEELGAGTSGVVYRAWDRRLARPVALKLFSVREPHAEDLAEARLLAQVRHPSVVTVFGADRIDQRVGLWMELIEGRTLEHILAADGPFSAREALSMVQDVCGALAAVHQAGLLHRDVKAQNIMRERGGRIVLMDFGAGLPHTTNDPATTVDLSGTPLYMAPELLAGQPSSIQSDLYSVGVLLFRLVSAAYPLQAATLADVRRAHEQGTRRQLRDLRPDLPERVVDVAERALDPVPGRRFESAGSMARALAAVAGDQVGTALTIATDHDRAAPRGMRGTRLAVVLLLTVLATTVAVLLVEHGPPVLRQQANAAVSQPVVPSSATWAPPDAPAVRMSQEQRDLVAGFEELAGTLGMSGDWSGAADIYAQIRAVHRDTIGEFAPVSALNIARSAWARHRGGRLDEARYLYEEAIVKLETTLGKVHPFLATTMGGLAMLHYQAGRPREAEVWLDRALRVRREVLGVPRSINPGAQVPSIQFSAVARPSKTPVLSDEDGDGLPPLIEAALGLDPTRADSDGDATLDRDELAAATGLTNCMLYCLAIDPTKLVAHYGAINPRREGFFRHYPIEGSGVDRDAVPAWEVQTGPLGYYFQELTAAQKSSAQTSGWRMLLRGRVIDGAAYAAVDLAPVSSRWDINLLLTGPNHTSAHLTTSVVPLGGPAFPVGNAERFPLMELVWSPAIRDVRYYLNGVIQSTRHPGTRQFQDERSLFFGTGYRTDETKRGQGEFALVWLEIW